MCGGARGGTLAGVGVVTETAAARREMPRWVPGMGLAGAIGLAAVLLAEGETRLLGGDGADTLRGGTGTDVLYYRSGDDTAIP